MKASESHKHYASKVRECSNFAVREIKKVCSEIGPRPAGEEGESKAQDYIEKVMEPIADSVERENFKLSPRAFMGWVLLDGICLTVAAVFTILSFAGFMTDFANILRTTSIVLIVLSLVFLVAEFLLYKKFLDPFFKKSESSNVVCTRKASGETKRRILLVGHIDSVYEWRFSHLGGPKLLMSVIILAVVGLLVVLGVCVAGFFVDGETVKTVLMIVSAIPIPFFIAIMFFMNWKYCVDGANDDLTGVFISMAVLKYLNDNDIRFENTEVSAISIGAEEAGLRGTKAYVEAHAKEFAEDGVETVFIAIDTVRDFEFLSVFTKDMTGTVTLDKAACELVMKASKNAEVPVKYSTVFFGSTDAAAAQQGGIRSASFGAMDPTPAPYYHTRLDTADNIDFKTIESGLKIMLETVFLFDEKGLN